MDRYVNVWVKYLNVWISILEYRLSISIGMRGHAQAPKIMGKHPEVWVGISEHESGISKNISL